VPETVSSEGSVDVGVGDVVVGEVVGSADMVVSAAVVGSASVIGSDEVLVGSADGSMVEAKASDTGVYTTAWLGSTVASGLGSAEVVTVVFE
jgi:hypothetical protein